MKLFVGSVKYERARRERKWTVFRYAIVAESREAALAKLKEKTLPLAGQTFLIPLHFDVYEVAGGITTMGNQLADHGGPFLPIDPE